MSSKVAEASDSSKAAEEECGNVKCITLCQPWASLVALGAKRMDTRSWRTWYRGPLLIHAARAFPKRARDLCKQEPFATVLVEAGYTHPLSGLVDPALLPLGVILAVCNLKHCTRIGTPGINLPPPEPERSFGDYTAGRYAWILSDVQPLLKPITAHGSMGLWEPDQMVLGLLPLVSPGNGPLLDRTG
jgi:hypothetical protein